MSCTADSSPSRTGASPRRPPLGHTPGTSRLAKTIAPADPAP